MQTLTFTQKLLRQRRFLSSLIPLFALFLGLGAAQAQSALQTSITSSTAVFSIDGGANVTYNGNPNTPIALEGANLGSFDINTGQLALNGGTVNTNESGTSRINAVTLLYKIYDPAFNTELTSGSINLPTTGGTNGGPRTFANSTAAIDLVSLVRGAGGTAATGYNLEVSYASTFRINGTGPSRTGATDGPYYATFDITGTVPPPNGVTFSNQTVIVDQGTGSGVTRNASVFNGTLLVDQKPSSTATPSFNINDGVLVLKGGSVTTTATGTSVVSGVNLNYTVLAPGPSFAVITTGMLQLTGGSTVAGVRTFELTTGTVNVITPIQTAGNGYVLSISYQASYQNGGGFPLTITDNGPTNQGYNATFDVDGIKTPAPTVQGNTIGIAPNNSGSVIYNINPTGSRNFVNADLSSPANNGTAYNVNNGQLRLNLTSVTTTEAGANTITSVVLYYRTRLANSPGAAFQPINLTQSGPIVNGTRTFILDPGINNINPQPNLIATPAVTAAGDYVVDVYYQASGTNSFTKTNFTITDPTGAPGTFYSANFTVTGTPIAQTIWTGALNDNWFDALNWSNGVPDETKNALIRDLGAGSGVPYPNINSDVTTPTYSNLNSGPAKCLNLIMGGTSQGSRSITRLVRGQLKVYGDFDNSFDSWIQRENTIMEFAGSTNQTITGGSFVRVDISGGATKNVVGIMNVAEAINFLTPNVIIAVPNLNTPLLANAGILTTNILTPALSVIVLADRAVANGNNGAQLNGETDLSYLRGFARTTRAGVLFGETRTYGNMGLTLTFTGTNSPGNVDVTRNTAEAYAPVSGRFGIRRIFGVRPADAATNAGGLTATMIFHYRDSETRDLNGADIRTPGNGTIAENLLTIFISTNGGGAFGLIGRDGPVDEVNNNVTKTGVTRFATFTLGSTETPLPVRLMAFDAKRIGSDALVTWQTATEENSKGYEVQVSTNGTEYRTLASIPSASPNTTTVTNYSYVDKEANKSGKRYYRLHQMDLDGKDAFFAPTVVSFDGKAPASTFVAYPNPLNAGNELHVALQSAATGTAKLLVTDMTGRTLQQQNVVLTGSLTDTSVAGMGDLKAGVYLVKITLPTGEVKNLKVVKQ